MRHETGNCFNGLKKIILQKYIAQNTLQIVAEIGQELFYIAETYWN